MKKSFTLIELLVVIAIIGILSSLVIARFSNWNDNARIANTLQWSSGVHRKLGANLVGHWLLNECSGGSGTIIQDISGYGNNGQISGSPTWSDGVPGNDGCSLKFQDGQRIDLPSFYPFNKTVTYSVWFKPNILENRKGIFGHLINGVWGYSAQACGGIFQTGNVVEGSVIESPLGYRRISYPITSNRWYHVILVKNMEIGNLLLYVDGSLVGSVSFNASVMGYWDSNWICSESKIAIAYYNSSQFNNFDGSIDDVRMYDAALTAEEISRIYAETKDSYLVHE